MPNLSMVERKHSFLSFFNKSKNKSNHNLSLKNRNHNENNHNENFNNKPPPDPGQDYSFHRHSTVYSPFAVPGNSTQHCWPNDAQYEPQLELSLENDDQVLTGSLHNLHHLYQNGMNNNNFQQQPSKIKQKIFKSNSKNNPQVVNRSKSSANLSNSRFSHNRGKSASNIYLSNQKVKDINISSDMKTAMYINDLHNNDYQENEYSTYSRKLLTLNSNIRKSDQRISNNNYDLDDNPNFLNDNTDFRGKTVFRDKNDFEMIDPGGGDGVGGSRRNRGGSRLYYDKEKSSNMEKGGYPTSFLKPNRASSFLHLRPGRSKTSSNFKEISNNRDSGGGSGSPELSSKKTESSENGVNEKLPQVSKNTKPSNNILKTLRRSLTNVGSRTKSVLTLGKDNSKENSGNTPKIYKKEKAIETLYDKGNLYRDVSSALDTGISSYAAETRSNQRSSGTGAQYTDLDNTSSNLVRQKLSPVSSDSNQGLQQKYSYDEEENDVDTGNNSDSPLANRKNINKNNNKIINNNYDTLRHSVGMDSTKAAAVRKHKLQEQILQDEENLENLAPSPPEQKIGRESRTASSITTSTRSETGSDLEETTSEDERFYEDKNENNFKNSKKILSCNPIRHLPPSGCRLQKSKTFVSRNRESCYASTNNCYEIG